MKKIVCTRKKTSEIKKKKIKTKNVFGKYGIKIVFQIYNFSLKNKKNTIFYTTS